MKTFIMVGLFWIALYSLGNLFHQSLLFHQDISTFENRIQIAVNHESVIKHLMDLKTNMKKRGMDVGFFDIYYETVEDFLKELERLRKIPREKKERTDTLKEIKEVIRELPVPVLFYLLVNHWDFCLFLFLSLVTEVYILFKKEENF